jgi:hypothetical protein
MVILNELSSISPEQVTRILLAEARRKVRAVARGASINITYRLSPESALDAFRSDLLLILGDEQ